MTIQITKDLSPRFGPIRHQGQRPTCVAFAISDLHASARCSSFEGLSVEYLYYHACRLETPFDPHSGVTLDKILEAVEKDGQPHESQWPYLSQLPTDLNAYRPPPVSGPIYRRKGNLLPGDAVNTILNELNLNRPSMLIFRSSLRFLIASAHTPVMWSIADTLFDPHAVVAVSSGNYQGARAIRVRNSWGSGWADSGYAWLHEDYVENTFIDLVGMV